MQQNESCVIVLDERYTSEISECVLLTMWALTIGEGGGSTDGAIKSDLKCRFSRMKYSLGTVSTNVAQTHSE